MFNGKISYRIVQIDSADDATISIKIYNKKSKNVVIIGDSMLNNINAKGLSKSKKFDKIDDVLEGKPKSLIVHVGTNDLTNNVNLLSNVKKIVNKVKNTSPDTALSFPNIFRRNKRNLEKMRADTNS